MSMPFYVAPEQFMKDKADFARKNIARGRPLVAVVFADGILICAENPSNSLHKVSEIYDRIAFAGVGRYNEFDQLRRSGVQHADIKGYQYSREDVDARSLANLYAQYMGNVFTHEMKPLEVEILVAEVGAAPGQDQLFHILYDGSVVDEQRSSVLGGEADAIATRLDGSLEDGCDLPTALRAAVGALGGPDRSLAAADLEVAVLDRANGRRAFRRVETAAVADLLAVTAPRDGGTDGGTDGAAETPAGTASEDAPAGTASEDAPAGTASEDAPAGDAPAGDAPAGEAPDDAPGGDPPAPDA
jgi:proteasome alpha subunit